MSSAIKPRLHPTTLGGRIGDPNGAIWWRNSFHVFHQQNTGDPRGGASSWGHLTSADLVHWTRHPAALEPDAASGEAHIFSGSARELPDGRLGLIHTVIYENGRPPEQHLAVADLDDRGRLIVDRSPGAVMTRALHGGLEVGQWRDPFLFEDGGTVFAVTGGSIARDGEPRGSVLLYRCRDQWLRDWVFEGVLFQHPAPAVWNIECPNFFPLGGSWVLLVSPHDCPQYFVGEWDRRQKVFMPERSDTLDKGALYATQILRTPDAAQADVMLGWMRTLPTGADEGWSGCHSFPRRLSLSSGKSLRQAIDKSAEKFRLPDHAAKFSGVAADVAIEVWFSEPAGPCSEMQLTLDLARSAGCDIYWGGQSGALNFHFDKAKGLLWIDGKVRWTGQGLARLCLRIFLDGCALEIFEETSGTAWSLVKADLCSARRTVRGRALGGTLRWEACVWPLQLGQA